MVSTAPGLALQDDFLVLGRTRLPLSSVRSLSVAQWTYPRRNSLFGMVEERIIELTIGLDLGEPLVYTLDEDRLPDGVIFTKEDFDGFDTLYGKILDATFPYRMAPYLKNWETNGSFQLGTVTFYPGQKIVFKKKTVPADQVVIRHMDRNLWVRNRKPSLLNHFNIRIPLTNDPDVMLALVKKFEGGTDVKLPVNNL